MLTESLQTMEGAFYLYEKGVGEEVQYGYLQLAQSLEEYVGKTFNDWVVTVDKELGRHLETQLMSTCHNKYVQFVRYVSSFPKGWFII